MGNLSKVLTEDSYAFFLDELAALADGKTAYEGECINQTLLGDKKHVALRLSVVPGYEETLTKVAVSVVDITRQKRAEERLRYLSSHDVLTGLYNRAYFEEEMARLDRGRQFPVSVLMADVDDLKATNDQLGHAAGDELLRRTARVLRFAFRAEDAVSRIGGDEFAVLLPRADGQTAAEALRRVQHSLMTHNATFRGPSLSLSIGTATAEKGSALTKALSQADRRMYADKTGRKASNHQAQTGEASGA